MKYRLLLAMLLCTSACAGQPQSPEHLQGLLDTLGAANAPHADRWAAVEALRAYGTAATSAVLNPVPATYSVPSSSAAVNAPMSTGPRPLVLSGGPYQTNMVAHGAAADSFSLRLAVFQNDQQALQNVVVFACSDDIPYRLMSKSNSGVNNGILNVATRVGEYLKLFKPGYESAEYAIERPMHELSVHMSKLPAPVVSDVSVSVEPSGALRVVLDSKSCQDPPTVLCSQADNPANSFLMQQVHAGRHSALIPLSDELEPKGIMEFRGKTQQGMRFSWFTTFALIRVSQDQDLLGPDSTSFNGNVGLSFPPGSLRGRGYIIATWTPHLDTTPGPGHVQIGKAQRLSLSQGLEFRGPATLRISVHEALLDGVVESFGLYQWDAVRSTWRLLSMKVDDRFRAVETAVEEMGVFSVFGTRKMS